MTDGSIRDHFEQQAKGCDQLGSQFTATLCRIFASDLDMTTRTGRRVLEWPGNPRDDALSLRLCAGLHRLVLAGQDDRLASVYPPNTPTPERLRAEIVSALARHDDRLCDSLDSPPQTNEVSRSAMLFPGLLLIARETGLPMELNEIGTSAGLNLLLDRFRFDYAGAVAGDQASAVHLSPEVRGATIPLDGRTTVVSRNGCDLAPIDISKPDERLRLRSYVWADQTMRMQRLDAALEQAQAAQPSVRKMDAEAFVRERLVGWGDGTVFVLSHSIMWQYMPREKRIAIETLMRDAGARATSTSPLAWLMMEPLDTTQAFATLELTIWPGGEPRRLARCDYHGRWIDWLDSA